MELGLELLLQLVLWLLELAFTVVGEGLFDFAWSRAGRKRATPAVAGPALTAAAYAAAGALCGVATLVVAPSHLIGWAGVRWLNLAASPIVAGVLLAFWRDVRGLATPGRAFAFADGWLFAFTLAAVRFWLAR
jgi:hypothetical protein